MICVMLLESGLECDNMEGYFKNIPHTRKFAWFPVKERTNIFGEGKWIWLQSYFEWYLPEEKFKERCSNFI